MQVATTDLVEHLQFIAHLFLKCKEPWRSRAYSSVADHLRTMQSISIEDSQLKTAVPGAGKAVSQTIVEFVATGTSSKFKKLRDRLPNETIDRIEAKVAKQKNSPSCV